MSNRKIVSTLAAIMLVASTIAVAQSTVYRWVDKDGKVHFSDTPPQEQAKSVTQKTMGGTSLDISQLPYATQVAMKKSPVTLYSGPECGDPCVSGRALLARRGIPFSERDAQRDVADAEALKKLVGALYVPVLVVGESSTKGFDEGSWNTALDGAGYPRSALPGQIAPKPPPPLPPLEVAPKKESDEAAGQPAQPGQSQ